MIHLYGKFYLTADSNSYTVGIPSLLCVKHGIIPRWKTQCRAQRIAHSGIASHPMKFRACTMLLKHSAPLAKKSVLLYRCWTPTPPGSEVDTFVPYILPLLLYVLRIRPNDEA